jgi:hypothetical protein
MKASGEAHVGDDDPVITLRTRLQNLESAAFPPTMWHNCRHLDTKARQFRQFLAIRREQERL